MLWLLLAFLSAIFTSLTTVLAKIGIKNVNSNFATFYRTGIVIIFCIILCLLQSAFNDLSLLTVSNIIFLILSGVATGCSWLCYYKAIKLGNINKVAPIDKSSFILTSILFLIFFYNDSTNNNDIKTIIALFCSLLLMFFGTMLMISKQDVVEIKSNKWLIYAILSSVFASLVSLFIKLGLKGINSSLGTLFRTIIVFIFSLCIVLIRKDYKGIKNIDLKSWIFLTLSGVATGGAWICEYSALNTINVNPIIVSSISKLAILFTMLFSYLILKEKFTKRSILGLILLTLGIILIIAFGL